MSLHQHSARPPTALRVAILRSHCHRVPVSVTVSHRWIVAPSLRVCLPVHRPAHLGLHIHHLLRAQAAPHGLLSQVLSQSTCTAPSSGGLPQAPGRRQHRPVPCGRHGLSEMAPLNSPYQLAEQSGVTDQNPESRCFVKMALPSFNFLKERSQNIREAAGGRKLLRFRGNAFPSSQPAPGLVCECFGNNFR